MVGGGDEGVNVAKKGLGRIWFAGGRALLIVGGLVMVFIAMNLRPDPAEAANPPPNFSDVRIADQIFSPTSLAMAEDGRLFVNTDAGQILIIENDRLLGTPALDIRSQVDDFADRGLFNMAFDNNFAQNGFIYVVYSFDSNGVDDGIAETRLSRFTMNGNRASNEVVLFDDFPDADVDLHYGGSIEMGPDGRLYIGVGDHLLGRNGQDRSNLSGSILRLNANGSIPTSNPFFGELQGPSRAIYAFGVRNPWQMAQHPTSGEIFFSDVGSNSYEELNVLERGANYGWFEAEGPKDPGDPASFVDPLWAYPHVDENPNVPLAGCAIVGGAFYETPNPTFPAEFRGQYFTGDFCEGHIAVVNPNTGAATEFMDGFNFGLLDLEVSPINGDLYYLDQTFNDDNTFPRGGIGKITFVGEQTDITITSQPSDVSIATGSDASFFVAATAPGDISYQWLRNGNPIPGATTSRLTVTNVDGGDEFDRFRVDVSSGGETVRSNSAVLRLSGNTAPRPVISFSGADGGYEAGQQISFSGFATDAEDGNISGGTLRWDVRLNHDAHDHALVEGFIGRNGTYTLPAAIETSTNVWITLYLTATDSDGTSTTVTQRIDPKIVTITVASDPSGLDIEFEGRDRTAPFSFDSVVGIDREIAAPATQTSGGATVTFQSWSDGRGRAAVLTTPSTSRTITARYSGGGGGVDCVVEASGSGVRLSFADRAGNEVVRNNDGWVATVAAGVTSYTGPGDVNDGWLIRRSGVNEVCSVAGGGGGGGDCVVEASGNGVRVTWSDRDGTEVLRNNDGWVASPAAGVTSYTGPGDVNDGFFIRRTRNGDEICSVGGVTPVPTNTCFVQSSGNGVRVTWQDKDGTEVLRNDDGWVASPAVGVLTYTGPGDTDDGFFIRRTRNGDETCIDLG